MAFIRPQHALSGLCAALLLVGCEINEDKIAPTSNNNSNTTISTNTMTVTPSLGKILNAKVTLKNAKTNITIGTANTGNLGKVSFQIPKDIKDVLIEVSGGGVAKYFDEAKGEQDLPSGVTLRAAASAITDNSNVGVSVFTEAAVQHAEKLTDGLKKSTNIIDANKKIGDAVGISNITQAPALIGQNSDYQQLADDAASAYALQLAALVKAASASIAGNTPALDLLEKLAADLSDGLIDGKNDTTTLTSVPYATLASVFAASWQLAMHEVINTLTNTELQAKFVSNVVNKVDIKEVNIGTVVTDDTDFGGGNKAAWKGEIYLLDVNTPKLPDFTSLTPIGTLFTNEINISDRDFTEPFPGVPKGRDEWFGVRYQGPLTITEAGTYQFATNSDDGSKLYIDNQLVVDNDFQHGQQTRSNTIELSAGVHTLRVEYFQGPRVRIALQVYGNKVGSPLAILTPTLPKVAAEAVAVN